MLYLIRVQVISRVSGGGRYWKKAVVGRKVVVPWSGYVPYRTRFYLLTPMWLLWRCDIITAPVPVVFAAC